MRGGPGMMMRGGGMRGPGMMMRGGGMNGMRGGGGMRGGRMVNRLNLIPSFENKNFLKSNNRITEMLLTRP